MVVLLSSSLPVDYQLPTPSTTMFCSGIYMYTYIYRTGGVTQHLHVHVRVIVVIVSWFLQCMGCVPHEGSTIPCTVKTMRQLTCTDRQYKATARLASVPEYSTYCTLAVQCKVLYARHSSIHCVTWNM